VAYFCLTYRQPIYLNYFIVYTLYIHLQVHIQSTMHKGWDSKSIDKVREVICYPILIMKGSCILFKHANGMGYVHVSALYPCVLYVRVCVKLYAYCMCVCVRACVCVRMLCMRVCVHMCVCVPCAGVCVCMCVLACACVCMCVCA